MPPGATTPSPTPPAGRDVPVPPHAARGTGGGGDKDLLPFSFEPPRAAPPSGSLPPHRGAAPPRLTRRQRQQQIRRHRLIVLGAFVVMLIILIIILAKACSGGGGGAAQPRPHKTNVHKTTAPGGVGVSPSPIDIVVRSVHVAQGQTVTVGYRINGPAGSKGNVKIAVKDKSDTVKELFTLASAQPTNRDLEYQFVAVLDPGTYKLSVVVTLTSGQKASGSSRLTVVSSTGGTPSPTST